MIGRRFRFVSAILVATVLMTSGGGLLVQQAAQAWGPLQALLARTVVRTIALREAEQRDRSNINQRRDAELAEVDLRERALDTQVRNGWMTEEDAARERERFDTLRTAIEERARRERQVVSFQTRNRIRDNLRSTLPDAIKLGTGADPRAVDFLAGILRGENPLSAAVGAVTSGGTPADDPREQFEDLKGLLAEVEEAAQGLRGAQGIAIRARVEQAVREATGLDIGDGKPPDDKISRMRELEDKIKEVADKIGDIGRDLFPGSEGISRERFADNERWQQLDAAVRAQEGPLAGRTIVSSVMRNAIDEAQRIAEEAGIPLTPEQLDAIVADVAGRWVGERLAGAGAGEATPIEDMARSAINESLATAGQDPLPTPTGAAVTARSVPAGGGAVPIAPTNVSATATQVTAPTATRVPTIVPPTATPQPNATHPAPTATTAPVVTFSGSFTENVVAGSVDSLTSTVNLTVDFATGAVTGSNSGSGSGNRSVTCSFPNGPTIDTAVLTWTASYTGSFTGTLDPATGSVSGSMSVGGTVNAALTQPYTHSQCVHLNQESPPTGVAWGGSGGFSGSLSENGGSITTNWTAGSATGSGTVSLSP